MLARWYQLDEARLIAEEEQLKKAGFQLDRDALRSRSRVEFTGSINDSKQDVAIRIICSEGFPYRIPTFVAPNLKLNPETRHISFRTHSICLRQAVPNGWDFEDHIVDLIDDARRVLVGQHTGDFGEEHTAPDQDLFGTQSAKWRIIIPEDLNSLPRENYLKCEARCLYQTKKHVLLLTKAGNRESAIEAPSDSQPIKMDLFRLSEIPIEFVRQFDDTFTAQRNIDILSQIQRNAAEGAEISRLRYILSKIKRHPLVVGIVFPFQNGRLVWQFFRVSAQGSRLEQEAFASHQLSDLSVRLSQSLNLAELFKARILIIGAGAIGSTIAVELACAGVGHIEICDFDHVTIGNIPRHEVSLAALGLPKVEAVKARILSKNPHTGVTAAQINILEDPQFEERVRMATVVVVSIGDENIERYINRVCVPENKPTVYAYAGLHASVGHIIRTLPRNRETGCLECFSRLYHTERSLIPRLPEPADPNEVAVEIGCNNPSLPGAGFDMKSIALIAVRKIVQTLLRDSHTYPDDGADVIVFATRRLQGTQYHSLHADKFELSSNPNCSICGHYASLASS